MSVNTRVCVHAEMSVSVEPSDLESGLPVSSLPSRLDLRRLIRHGCSGARRLSTSKQRFRWLAAPARGRSGVDVAVVVSAGLRLVLSDCGGDGKNTCALAPPCGCCSRREATARCMSSKYRCRRVGVTPVLLAVVVEDEEEEESERSVTFGRNSSEGNFASGLEQTRGACVNQPAR